MYACTLLAEYVSNVTHADAFTLVSAAPGVIKAKPKGEPTVIYFFTAITSELADKGKHKVVVRFTKADGSNVVAPWEYPMECETEAQLGGAFTRPR